MLLKCVLLFSCLWRLEGVFGVNVRSVSVKVDDSVTLNLPNTEINDFEQIRWTFEDNMLAKIKRWSFFYVCDEVLDERFRFKLKLDHQTGSLTITDITTEHAGDYQLWINQQIVQHFRVSVDDPRMTHAGENQPKKPPKQNQLNENEKCRITVMSLSRRRKKKPTNQNEQSEKKFRVTVNDLFGEIKKFKLVNVKEGDSVTLDSDRSEIKDEDVIQWRYGNENALIAEINKRASSVTVYNGPDGRFRDRLKVNHQTGSLTITNFTTEHTGFLQRKINQMRMDFLLAVHAGEISILEGDSVTLNSGFTEKKDDDEMPWLFLKKTTKNSEVLVDSIYRYDHAHYGRFKERLKIDKNTGDLIITNTPTEYTGEFIQRTRNVYKSFSLMVYARLPVPVIRRNSSSSSSSCSLVCSAVNVGHVTLSWYKGNSLLSSISVSDLSFSLSLPLEVEYQDKNTYSCVLSNPISHQTQQLYITQLCEPNHILVKEGDSVTLHSSLTKMKDNDQIQWKFDGMEDTVIAEINNRAGSITVYDGPDGKFRDRLKVDSQTGALTITNITTGHSGYYERKINCVSKSFHLIVHDKISVMEGDSVTLSSGVTELDPWDFIQWYLSSEKMEVLIDGVTQYKDAANGRFRDRIKMDKITGSLTITNITTEDTGHYVLTSTVLWKSFNLTVYADLPVPVISRDCSSSSSYCSFVCSAVNVSHVTLSWYKGNSLLSSISASDLSSLSLHLEVEYQDENTYSCVLNNPISHQTQHLDITQLCHTCAAAGLSAGHIALLCVCALALAAVLCGIYYYHERKTSKCADPGGGETSYEDRHSQNGAVPLLAVEVNGVFVKEDKITSVPVMEGQSVTLHTDNTELQDMEDIWWKFANFKERNCAKFVVIATLSKTNNEEHPYNRKIIQFSDSLKLDQNTGSLTITKITPKHYGHYKLHITSKGQMIVHTFSVLAQVPLNRKQIPALPQRRQTCP